MPTLPIRPRRSLRPATTATSLFLAAGALMCAAAAAAAGPAGRWTLISPPSQSGGAAAFDASRNAMYVFGGRDSTGGAAPNATYLLDAAQAPAIWTTIAPTPSTPVAGYSISAIADENHGQAVLFGGTNGTTFDSSVHTFDFASGIRRAQIESLQRRVDDPPEPELAGVADGSHLSRGRLAVRTGHGAGAGRRLGQQPLRVPVHARENSTSYWQNSLDPGASDELRSSATFV